MPRKRIFHLIAHDASRQERYQQRKMAEGLCAICGKNPLTFWKRICAECREKRLVKIRKRRGNEPWKEGKAGRGPNDRERRYSL